MLKERISDLTKILETERALNIENTTKANTYNKVYYYYYYYYYYCYYHCYY